MLKSKLKKLLYLALCLPLLSVPALSHARQVEPMQDTPPPTAEVAPRFQITQSNGMTLSQAVDSVRRRGNVERVISASTRVSNGREVHYIKVLTKDGKVRTHKVQGRKLN